MSDTTEQQAPCIRVVVEITVDVSEAAWRQRYALDARMISDTRADVERYFVGLVADAVPVKDGSARVVDAQHWDL